MEDGKLNTLLMIIAILAISIGNCIHGHLNNDLLFGFPNIISTLILFVLLIYNLKS